jgi:flagella basal body P-ring formation protein FlgA
VSTAYHECMNTPARIPFSRSAFRSLIAAFGLLLTISAAAQPPQAAKQEPRLIRQTVEKFLHLQTTGMPGDVAIEVGGLDPRLNLPACPSLHPFLPTGSRTWGKTTVGVRCNAGMSWTVYVQATVRVHGDYYVTAAPLAQGAVLEEAQLAKVRGDLAALPAGVITDPEQAVGKALAMPLAAGLPLRQDMLRSQPVVQQGQVVRIVVNGPGFSLSNEGRALASGTDGQLVRARTQHGQIVSGIAKSGGVVVVTY